MPALLKTNIAWALAVITMLATQWVQASGIVVRDVSTMEISSQIVLSAQLDLELSEEALKALEHGVAIEIVIEMETIEARNWLWDRTVAKHSERFHLERQALSKHYIVTHEFLRRSFLSLREALEFIGTIHDYPLVNSDLLEYGKSYRGRLRAWLDIESLPAPMRPAAYISSQWHIDSAWHEWPLKS